jgi:hypothetical protein
VRTAFGIETLRKEGSTMRKLASLFASLVVLCALAGGALADKDSSGGGAAASSGNKGNGKVKVYDFSGDNIEGDLIKPEGTTVDARDFAQHSSLIKIRKDFIPEIIKSAEDL